MKNVVLWIDKDQALLFSLSASGFLTEFEVDHNKIDHHNGLKQDKKDKGDQIYYHQIAERLEKFDAMVVVGPGIVKDQFSHYCQNSYPNVGKKIKGMEITGNRIKESDLQKAMDKYFLV